MADHFERYEVFIKSTSVFMKNGVALTMWSWSRLSAVGQVLVCGSGHASLEACFASVRLHAAQFGEVPVKINLGQPARTSPPVASPVPVAQRDGMIANIDPAPASRINVPAPAVIAALSAPSLRYAS
ncbi:MAG: hypothetical protein V4475_16780 [Pseudomonadota bacterium]